MGDLGRFLEESAMAEKVALPSIVVLRDVKLSYATIKGIMESGVFEPDGVATCELEVGGKRIARGRIVRRPGGHFFKVTQMDKGDET
jgi:hypothetical protein